MSEKTVAAKLLIKPGTAVWISELARVSLLGPLPGDASLVASPSASGVAVVIADDAAAIRAALAAHLADLGVTPLCCGSPTRRVAVPTSTGTPCGGCWPHTDCGRSPRWQSTRRGRRSGSGRCGRTRSSSGAALGRAHDDAHLRPAAPPGPGPACRGGGIRPAPNGLRAPFVLTCVGSLSRAALRPAGAPATIHVDGDLEDSSLVGTLSEDMGATPPPHRGRCSVRGPRWARAGGQHRPDDGGGGPGRAGRPGLPTPGGPDNGLGRAGRGAALASASTLRPARSGTLDLRPGSSP